MAAFSWLHITDSHHGRKGQGCLWSNLRQPFLDDLTVLHQRTGPWQAVFFTGDLVQRGTSDEFREMQQEVLDRLWDKLRELGSGNAVLFAVPGNHDLYRPDPNGDNAAIDTLLYKEGFGRIVAKFWDNPVGPYRRVVNQALGAYSEWWRNAPNRPESLTEGVLPGDFACTLECRGWQIGIVGLNTTFLQLQGGDYRGQLVWDVRQLHAVCGGTTNDWLNKHHVCLLLTHQGPDWLEPEARSHGESEIAPAGRFAVHFFGHAHEADILYVRRGANPDAMCLCQACSVFGMETFGEPPTLTRHHGYTAGRIEFTKRKATLRLWPRVATNATGPWRFIPDYVHGHLLDDQGTAPETISVRPLTRAPGVQSAVGESLPPRFKATETGGTARRFAPHSTLPSRRPFFGRAEDLEKMAQVLQPEHVGWGVIIYGRGGIGKTALAIEGAHRAPAEHYPLKLFVTAKGRRLDPGGEHPLQDCRVDDYFALLSEIGRALGHNEISRAAPEQRPDLVRHVLAEHPALLVLDNLESFTRADCRRVYDLLEVLPRVCRVIVTTRRYDETAARILRLDKLDAAASNQLLDSLGETWPSLARLTPQDKHRLYIETDGNPLLLRWTAGQLGRAQGRCRTVEQAVARLQEAHLLASTDSKNDPLEFVFSDLLDTFTEEETLVLAALAHFTNPARVEWLLPLTNLGLQATRTALDDLRDRALLTEDATAGTWLLPPLAARFLRRCRPEAIGLAGQRLAARALALAAEHGYPHALELPQLEAVWPIIQAALPLLIGGANDDLQKLCNALWEFLGFTGRWDERILLNQKAEEKALAAGDCVNAGWRAYQAGMIHYERGEAEAVLACADRCSAHWRQARVDARGQSVALQLRGLGCTLRKQYEAAVAACQEAVGMLRSLGSQSQDLAIGLNGLAIAKREFGDLDGAQADCQEALRIVCKMRHREGVASCVSTLVDIFLDREDWAEAERQARKVLGLAQGVGRQELIGENHRQLAKAMLRQQRATEALPYARKAVAILTPLHSRELEEAKVTLRECEAAMGSR